MRKDRKRIIYGVCAIIIMVTIFVGSNAITTKKDDNRVKIAYDYLQKNSDLNEAQIIGILSNIREQSNFKTEKHNEMCTGLLAWTFHKEDELEKFAKKENKNVNDLYLQLDFIVNEVNSLPESISYNGYTLKDWNNVENADDASIIFSSIYIRPRAVNEDRLLGDTDYVVKML